MVAIPPVTSVFGAGAADGEGAAGACAADGAFACVAKGAGLGAGADLAAVLRGISLFATFCLGTCGASTWSGSALLASVVALLSVLVVFTRLAGLASFSWEGSSGAVFILRTL